MKALIVIPTYNESGNIEPLITAILATVPQVDVLVIDDASQDGTGDIVDGLVARLPQVHVLHRAGKLGLGTAYLRGFDYASEHGYDLVFEMDADFSHDPKYLPAFLAAAQGPDAADLVIGSRYIPGGDTPDWSPLRKFISGGGNIFARTALGIPIHDCTSGFRCYHTAALRTLHLDQVHSQGYAFQVELAYAMWRSGYHVREVPITFIDRRVGHSKMSRKIFIEGFTWVLRTRINGSPVMRRNASAMIPPTMAPAPDDATREAPTGR
ncbi:MAG TPA: polyprenol monophosphomannose synthase [Ktedonobacterales bacterium]|nr:polyprenol monophosphomannose synthase [Ktedonobacterales bacterium]